MGILECGPGPKACLLRWEVREGGTQAPESRQRDRPRSEVALRGASGKPVSLESRSPWI